MEQVKMISQAVRKSEMREADHMSTSFHGELVLQGR